MSPCTHQNVRCLNGYELIRKYRCDDCAAVMMCACDEEIGRKHLSHQLEHARELDTQLTVPVTAGFVANVCEACRAQPLTAYPKAAIHGHTSKLRRYYWREIAFEKMKRFDTWSMANRGSPPNSLEAAAARRQVEQDVLADIKRLHATNTKYVYATEKDADIIKKYSVTQIELKATYTNDPAGAGAIILGSNGPCTVEDFVSDHYRAVGYDVMPLESVPFHVLFGVFMWLVLQDPADPLLRLEGFGDRNAFEEGRPGDTVWFHRSADFGTKGYAKRRAQEITQHLSPYWNADGVLQGLFDYWLEPSETLRQYLWAHRGVDVERARKLIDIIPPDSVVEILRYLVSDYWHHYLGWPDLLVYRPGEFFLAEVKASGDKFSDEQKVWVAANHERFKLPFKLVKVHKIGMAASLTAP